MGTLAWLGICIMWCNVLAHIQNSLHVCVTCTLVELFLMCLGHEFVYRRWPLDCVAVGIRLLHVHPKLFLACPEWTAGALKSVCAQHGHRPRANRLHNTFKLAYLFHCDKSQPWQPVDFMPMRHLQAVCRHLGWCCMATGRVPTVSIILSSSHTYFIATSRSPGSH